MLYLILAALLVALDQAVKFLVRAHIPLGGSLPVLPGVLDLTYVQNTGAAFSLFTGHTWLLTIISLAVSVALAAALAGAAVSFAGLLGFVGLVAPHMVRRLVGGESRRLLAGCALGGAALLTVCDVAARTLFAPYELPVGVVLSLAGGPFFLWLLFRKGRGHP
mgnify:CR=1 FL=1